MANTNPLDHLIKQLATKCHFWFRWCLLDTAGGFYWRGFATSMLVGAVLLATGLWYFRRTERSFADVI